MAGYLHEDSVYGRRSNGHRQDPLPFGACGFRDLSVASNSFGCGCKRFWLNTQQTADQGNGGAWCYCGHHACFHDEAGVNAAPRGIGDISTGTTTYPTSRQSPPAQTPRGYVHMSQTAAYQNASSRNSGSGVQDASQIPSQSINTRLWQALTGFARDQDDDRLSNTTSRLPSTRVPSAIGESRPSPKPWIHLQHHFRPLAPVSVPLGAATDIQTEECSATEVATPSVRGTPDLRAAVCLPIASSSSSFSKYAAPPESIGPTTEGVPFQNQPHVPQITQDIGATVRMSLREMENAIQDFGRRVSVLESMSFNHIPCGEVQDNFDLFDGRLIDLELWRTDMDKHRLDPEAEEPNRPNHKRLLPTDGSSFTSDGSFDSDAAAHTEAVVLATLAASAEIRPRVDGLESRIAELESVAMPSWSRPWHVQIVVLPFGRHLPGIWYSATASTEHSQQSAKQGSEGWRRDQSAMNSSNKSLADGTWTTESIQAWANETQEEWLLPKACGPGGTVFQRLESRGLVQNIILTASDAQHISKTILNAFASVLHHDEGSSEVDGKDFRGLDQQLIPLRKVRKSTRLRFLSPAEMVTPALWTAEFLETCVFMKVDDGPRRLYMTTPEAYLQPSQPGWTWQMIKYLPLHGANGDLQAAQDDGTIIEACWTYNQRLDHVPSLDSSFNDEESVWSTKSRSSIQHDVEENDPSTAGVSYHHSLRSLSFSNGAVAPLSDSQAKRRVVSHEMATVGPQQTQSAYLSKRRRISDLTEVERGGVNYTPRWSREPPSPHAHDDQGHLRSQVTKRGITPTAYATPHSHFDSSRAGDFETEMDTEIHAVHSSQDEDLEEWEGVQDGPESEAFGQDIGSSSPGYQGGLNEGQNQSA